MKWDRLFLHYGQAKLVYSASLSITKCLSGEIAHNDVWRYFRRALSMEKMTYLYKNEDQEMVPTIPGKHETLLIRKLPSPNHEFRLHYDQVSVGDVVLLKNPLESDKLIVRRLAALGGQQMVSTDEKDEPFFTDYDECWVLSDNNKLTAKEAKDSRTFGPVSLMDIMGRVLYRFRSIHDHGVVNNSNTNAKEDSAVVRFELDLNEMQKISEA
ncbi:mitochondrial ATP-independent inner membrane protease subunit 2-like isoform X1 [Amaranthus tricolor]|uniref:mitochondrial ATP-independent inner membrane protease subunit 2-like isoform X1 n=1 Tax=Amaranthus tricolor TaxID=29722 RepID=UPI002584C017|nr:mitochondrial ATP-independent inner membrane protease subunit 2-like isoform X1 [Amaranthus tricolor]